MKKHLLSGLSILEGCILVATGIHLLSTSHLLISGAAGLALILKETSSLPFAALFFVINLPFYFFAYMQMGRSFTVRTFASVTVMVLFQWLLSRVLIIPEPQPAISALLGGLLTGFGMTLLFRQKSSLGGLNIMSVYLEKKYGIHSGLTTLLMDITLFCTALLVLPSEQVLFSLIAFAAMASVIGRYHRPEGRRRKQSLALPKIRVLRPRH